MLHGSFDYLLGSSRDEGVSGTAREIDLYAAETLLIREVPTEFQVGQAAARATSFDFSIITRNSSGPVNWLLCFFVH